MKSIIVPEVLMHGLGRCRKPAVWACALAALAASLVFLKWADVVTGRTRGQLAVAEARLAEVESAENAALALAQQVARAKALLSQSAATGFSASQWDARRFNMKQLSTSREAMNKLIGEVSRSPERYFSADQFELSVKRPDESLFVTPADPASELVLTLRGSLYFKAATAKASP